MYNVVFCDEQESPETITYHHTSLHTYTDHRDNSLEHRKAPAKRGGVSPQITEPSIGNSPRRGQPPAPGRSDTSGNSGGMRKIEPSHWAPPTSNSITVPYAHILCDCPALSLVRLSNQIDFNRAVRCLPPSPERALGQAVVPPLLPRGQLCMGLWTPDSEPAGGSWSTSAHGPPPASLTYGVSTTTHWRTTPLERKFPGLQPTITPL